MTELFNEEELQEFIQRVEYLQKQESMVKYGTTTHTDTIRKAGNLLLLEKGDKLLAYLKQSVLKSHIIEAFSSSPSGLISLQELSEVLEIDMTDNPCNSIVLDHDGVSLKQDQVVLVLVDITEDSLFNNDSSKVVYPAETCFARVTWVGYDNDPCKIGLYINADWGMRILGSDVRVVLPEKE